MYKCGNCTVLAVTWFFFSFFYHIPVICFMFGYSKRPGGRNFSIFIFKLSLYIFFCMYIRLLECFPFPSNHLHPPIFAHSKRLKNCFMKRLRRILILIAFFLSSLLRLFILNRFVRFDGNSKKVWRLLKRSGFSVRCRSSSQNLFPRG